MRHLDDPSDASIRAGLAEVAPGLVDEPIRHIERVPDLDPEWFRGTARLGDAHVVKYAWSAPAARRIGNEARVLALLGGRGVAVPALVHDPGDLAVFVTRYVDGVALHDFPDGERARWADGIAATMLAVHETPLPEDLALPPAATWVQATADQLRDEEFLEFLPNRQHHLVVAWCDWVDETLSVTPDPVLVHGDLHGFNMVCDPGGPPGLVLTDLETAGPGECALDFRYHSSQSDENGFVDAVVGSYRSNGGAVDERRIAAWTILSVLGDARWRSLAGIGLPYGGTPEGWVDDLARRLPQLCPAVPTP